MTRSVDTLLAVIVLSVAAFASRPARAQSATIDSLQDELSVDYVCVIRVAGPSRLEPPDEWGDIRKTGLAFRLDTPLHQSPFVNPIPETGELVVYRTDRAGGDLLRADSEAKWLVFLGRVGKRHFNCSRAFRIDSENGAETTRWLWKESGSPAQAELSISLDEARKRVNGALRQSPEETLYGFVPCGAALPPTLWQPDYFECVIFVAASMPSMKNDSVEAPQSIDDSSGETAPQPPRRVRAFVHRSVLNADTRRDLLGTSMDERLFTGRWVGGSFRIDAIVNDWGEAR